MVIHNGQFCPDGGTTADFRCNFDVAVQLQDALFHNPQPGAEGYFVFRVKPNPIICDGDDDAWVAINQFKFNMLGAGMLDNIVQAFLEDPENGDFQVSR